MLPVFHESFPPASSADLARFEREAGLHLPDDYRAFLLVHNGGLAEPEYFRGLSGSVHELAFWYGINYQQPDSPANLLQRWNVAGLLFRGPTSLVCIANGRDGDLLLLSLDPADKGHLYLWFRSLHPTAVWDQGPEGESAAGRLERMGMRLLASSFSELLASAMTEDERKAYFIQRLSQLEKP